MIYPESKLDPCQWTCESRISCCYSFCCKPCSFSFCCAENDYQVNIKSELEILQVHEKLNELRERDWAALVELQNRQIEMLQQLLQQAAGAAPRPAQP